jgi:NIPSNAP
MDLKPIYIVDTLAVRPAHQLAMLSLLKEEGIPVMQEAGLELVGCYSTSPDLGEDVLIQVTWKAPDHSAFNLIRKEFVTDPRWWSYAARASALWTGGTRRFFYPAPMAVSV